ncbi:MAG: hypothetical protein II323_06985, partial [Tidjanibacter sp.]|nr:hypothetical protein [Tidjanibacter sp.]
NSKFKMQNFVGHRRITPIFYPFYSPSKLEGVPLCGGGVCLLQCKMQNSKLFSSSKLFVKSFTKNF